LFAPQKRLLSGYSDLVTPYPEITSKTYGWDVTKVLAKSYENIAWKCVKNHIWVEKIINRTENNSNCPKC
jgi:hypothetical protein